MLRGDLMPFDRISSATLIPSITISLSRGFCEFYFFSFHIQVKACDTFLFVPD